MATKSKRATFSKTVDTVQHSGRAPHNREEWIAVAAYFRAEQRGFQEGSELSDWLDAERELSEHFGVPRE